MSKNRGPITKQELRAIKKDFAEGVGLGALVKKYHREFYSLRALLGGPPRPSKKRKTRQSAPSLDKVNEALSYSDKGHGAHSALFKQIFALLKERAPEIHRVTLDVENRQAEFNTVTSHKVTL